MPLSYILRLLDTVELCTESGEPLAQLPIGKGLELLALLAYRKVAVPRVEIASLLWVDTPEATARHRLRTLLLDVRRRYPGLLEIGRDRVGLATGVDARLDEGGHFAPGVDAEWLLDARADLAYHRVSRLLMEAQSLDPEDRMRAIELTERAQRLVPESLAAEALLGRLRSRPSTSHAGAARILSLGDRARLALARTPLDLAAGDLVMPVKEIEILLQKVKADSALFTSLLISRAGFAYELGDFIGATHYAGAAITIDRAGVPSRAAEVAQATLWLARAAYSSGNFDGSVAHSRRVVHLAGSSGETHLLVYGECLLAASELLRGRHERVEEHLVRGRRAAGNDAYLLSRCHNVAGWAALSSGATAHSRRHFEAAVEGGEGERRGVANSLQGLARALQMGGDSASSRKRLQEAAQQVEGTDLDLAHVGVLSALADLDELEGRYEEALESHRRSLARRSGSGERLGVYTSLSGIGRLCLKLGRTVESVHHLREAYAVHVTILGEVRLPIAALPLAEALLTSGRTREAKSLLQRSVEILAAEEPAVRAGNGYPADIPALAKRLTERLQG